MNDDDKKAETKLVFVVLACIRFCSFVLSESCSGNRYESCSGEIKISYTALLDYAMRESLLNKLSIDTSYRAFLRLMWYIHRLLSFQAMIVLVLSSIGLRLLRWHCKLTMVRNGYYPEVWSVKVRSSWSWVWLFHYAPTLSVEQLPTTVCFAQSNEDNSDLPHRAQNEISKPIVVLPLGATKANTSEMPIEAPNNSDLPIVEGKSESPIVVINSELPIVATKAIPEKPQTETNSKLYESNLPGSSITFGNISQGSFNHDTQNDNDSPFIPLHTALENVFTDNNYAIFILDGYMVSIIHNPNSGFYVFDSHARNSFGMPDMNGKAVVLNLRNMFSLENYLQL